MLGVGGAPSGFFFFGGALAWSGLYSWGRGYREKWAMRTRLTSHFSCFSLKVAGSYLKGRPVHMHPGSVVVAEPLQILLCVCSQDCAFQFSVYCGIAEERKVEQTARMREPEQTLCVCLGGGTHKALALESSKAG